SVLPATSPRALPTFRVPLRFTRHVPCHARSTGNVVNKGKTIPPWNLLPWSPSSRNLPPGNPSLPEGFPCGAHGRNVSQAETEPLARWLSRIDPRGERSAP